MLFALVGKYNPHQLSLVHEKLDRKESRLLGQSKYFKKLVQKGLQEIKEGKVSPWKEVWDEL